MVDFIFFACLNIHMLGLNRSKYRASNYNTYLNTKTKLRSKREDIHSLMRKLKKKEQKKIKEKYIFTITAVGFLVVSGIIVSF